MGMRDDIQNDLGAAFDDDLADAVSVLTLVRKIASDDYDPDTGTTAYTEESFVSRGILSGFSEKEIDGTRVLSTDTKCSILQNEIAATPIVDDVVNSLRVMAVNKDPAGATWILQLRAS